MARALSAAGIVVQAPATTVAATPYLVYPSNLTFVFRGVGMESPHGGVGDSHLSNLEKRWLILELRHLVISSLRPRTLCEFEEEPKHFWDRVAHVPSAVERDWC
jgi:hypothetical protein